jgi:hypothetical protein
MLMYMTIPASVPAGMISLEDSIAITDITEKAPCSEIPTTDEAIFGINSVTSSLDHVFQDDLSVPAIPGDNHRLEDLGKDVPLIPSIEFSNIDPRDLKQFEFELRFLAPNR